MSPNPGTRCRRLLAVAARHFGFLATDVLDADVRSRTVETALKSPPKFHGVSLARRSDLWHVQQRKRVPSNQMSQSMCFFSVNSSVIYHEANESNLPARHASQVRYRQTREAQLNMIYKARPYSQTSSSPEKDLESAEFWQSPSCHCGSTPVYSFLFCARPRNQGVSFYTDNKAVNLCRTDSFQQLP